MIEHKMDHGPCPYCGAAVDMVSPISGTSPMRPGPGDFTICVFCRRISRYDDDLKQQRLTPANEDELRGSELWPMIQGARRLLADVEHQSLKIKGVPGETT